MDENTCPELWREPFSRAQKKWLPTWYSRKLPAPCLLTALAPRGCGSGFLRPRQGRKEVSRTIRKLGSKFPISPPCFPVSSSSPPPPLPTTYGATSNREILKEISEPSTQP